MSTIEARDVVESVNAILNDVLSVRWEDPELLGYLNAAQLAIAAKRPDASVRNTSMQCVAQAKQTLPESALRLLKVIGHTASGKSITLIDVAILDEQLPDWRSTTNPAPQIQHYIYDDRDPKHFYLFPVPVANLEIDLVYSVAPMNIKALESPLSIDDIFLNPIVDYMLYRSYQKDSENQSNAARASSHYAAFKDALGEKTKADAAVSPANG